MERNEQISWARRNIVVLCASSVENLTPNPENICSGVEPLNTAWDARQASLEFSGGDAGRVKSQEPHAELGLTCTPSAVTTMQFVKVVFDSKVLVSYAWPAVDLLIWEFPIIRGTLFWGPYNKDTTIWGTILGSPIFGNSHIWSLY